MQEAQAIATSYRYKLALSVDTPEGVKSGFSVGSVRHAEENGWGGRGGGSRTTGEALYLDLGPGNRPLVALLTRKLKPGERSYGTRWEEDSPTLLLARLYGEKQPVENVLDVVLRFAKYRGPSVITTADLPDLVTFADIIEPKSVLAVDPDNLPAVLGRDVRWHNLTIEVTDEPVTNEIEQKLPWLKTMTTGLDGSSSRYYGERASLPNSLNALNFIRRGI